MRGTMLSSLPSPQHRHHTTSGNAVLRENSGSKHDLQQCLIELRIKGMGKNAFIKLLKTLMENFSLFKLIFFEIIIMRNFSLFIPI